MDEGEEVKKIKVIVVGSCGVGKTSLITRYATGKFIKETTSTCGASFITKKKEFNGETYILNIWDTAGQEKFNSLTKIFTKNSNIAIMVYSIIDKTSFTDLDNWHSIITEENSSDLVIGIAANKNDLYLNSQVSDTLGKQYSSEKGFIWKSTSALSDDKGIDSLIDETFLKYIQSLKKKTSKQETVQLTKKTKKNGGCCSKNKNDGKDSKNENSKNEKELNNAVNKKMVIEDEDF